MHTVAMMNSYRSPAALSSSPEQRVSVRDNSDRKPILFAAIFLKIVSCVMAGIIRIH